MGEAPKNKDTRYHPYQAPSACEARRDLTAASLVWPELRVERLRVLRVLWLHCGWGRNVAAASTRFWLFAELTYVEEHIPQSDTTQHTHTARRCVRVRHHLPRFPDVQKQSVPPSWLSSETADPENNWSKILPSYFKYLQSYGLSKYLLGLISGLT